MSDFAQVFRWTENLAQRACALHLGWHAQTVIPNAYFGGGEADILVINPRRFVTEIEIKLTLADWAADRRKAKWASAERQQVRYFAYAVPEALLTTVPEWVAPTTGLISLTSGYSPSKRAYDVWARWWRKPKPLGKHRVDDQELQRLLRGVYCRYWQQIWRLPVMSQGMLEDYEPPEAEFDDAQDA